MSLGSRPSAPEWVHLLSFRFDPFEHLEASADPYLAKYFISPTPQYIVTLDAPLLVLAPPGAGKTALSIYVARSCWLGAGAQHPFPLFYTFPKYLNGRSAPTFADHTVHLAHAAAAALLISLAFRPELYLALRPTDRRAVASALQRDLRHSLSHCLRTLDENGNVVDLADQLDPSYRLSDPPKPAQVREFVAVLKASTPSETSHTSTEFEEWIELLLGRLGFESIYALCDGIDAFPETAAARTDVADAWLAPLLDHVETWAGRRVYLKAFLPIELESYWRTHHLRRTSSLPGFRLDWTVERLSQAIRKRIEVASEGKFDSLDAISSTAIRDLETLLASQVPPLPREVLWVARETLRAFSQRVGGRVGSALEPEDVAAGLAAYRQQRSGSLFGQLGDRLPPALPQQGALTTVSL